MEYITHYYHCIPGSNEIRQDLDPAVATALHQHCISTAIALQTNEKKITRTIIKSNEIKSQSVKANDGQLKLH